MKSAGVGAAFLAVGVALMFAGSSAVGIVFVVLGVVALSGGLARRRRSS
jgi:hypothetical protein